LPCNTDVAGTALDGNPLQWSFDFDSGFQGTDLESKLFYVMVYYPAPPSMP
jgi:hypothetical protein